MRTFTAIAGSAIFLIAAPGVVAGLIPWLLSDRWGLPWSAMPGFVLAGWGPDPRRAGGWGHQHRSRRPKSW
nr:hypothetical protein [Mesorhizobium opportunistum]